ncbi:MAG: PAS domain S-box protein [Candidatus Eisenbacteria bacterium]|uniref:PAS domain S-box protein n=1 Tax=Eiseniibacteriota bacterium TaxID=2212470 RepID=A0A938BPY6_UNCEI|nr:PAS domain S-box protein [Candidatus Eisenbacteria bacterium]
MSGTPQDSPEALRRSIEAEHARLLDRAIEPQGGGFVDAELAAGYLSLLRSLASLPREHLLGLRVLADLPDAGFAGGRALGIGAVKAGRQADLLLFRRLADASGYGFAVADTSGTLTYANRALCRMYGLESPADAAGRSMADHAPDESRAEFAGQVLPAALRLGQWVGELAVRSVTGVLTPAIQNIFLVHGDELGGDHIAALVLDITERKQAEIALEQAKRFAENLIETANAIVVGLDPEGRIRIFNRAAEQITGYRREELEGRSWFEVLVPRERFPAVWEMFQRLGEGGLARNFENPILTKSGEERYIVWQNAELREQDRLAGTVSFGIDITERKRAEEALRRSEEAYRELVESLDEVLFTSDMEGVVTYISPAAVRLSGYSIDEIVGQPFTRFIHPDDAPGQLAALARLQAGEQVAPPDWRLMCKSGEPCWVRSSTRLVFRDGRPAGIRGVIVDIDARRRAEEALGELRDLHEAVIEEAGLGVAIVQDERIRYVNRSIARWAGYEPEELIDRHFAVILPPEDAAGRIETHRRRMRGEEAPRAFRVEVLRKDGRSVALQSQASLVRYRGRPAMLVVVRSPA